MGKKTPPGPKPRRVYTDDIAATRCVHCGGYHTMECPRVASIEFVAGGENGQRVAKVNFWPTGWEQGWNIMWREDFEEPEELSGEA
jgi:hypothetical protein